MLLKGVAVGVALVVLILKKVSRAIVALVSDVPMMLKDLKVDNTGIGKLNRIEARAREAGAREAGLGASTASRARG